MRAVYFILCCYVIVKIAVFINEKENRENEQNNIKWWNN